MTYDFERFLEPRETITGRTKLRDDAKNFNFDIVGVSSPTLGDTSRVFLDVSNNSSKNVLIGGNPLDIDVLQGIGKVSMIDLKDGKYSELILWPKKKATVPSDNILYWYENMGARNLQLRDTCPGFDMAHEPSVEDVVQVISRTILG